MALSKRFFRLVQLTDQLVSSLRMHSTSKEPWNAKFDASETEEQDFHLPNGSSVKVPFMTSKKKQLLGEFDSFKVLVLLYKQHEDKRQFSMYFYLPDTKDGLPDLVDKLSQPAFINSHLQFQDVEVGDFKIPKFKFSFGFEASKVLKDLGLVLPFSGEGGGLSEMVDLVQGQNLYVSSIFHKSFVEVKEEGTEAAADFVADHPFMFLIREDMTDMVLFVGQVLNPAQIA